MECHACGAQLGHDAGQGSTERPAEHEAASPPSSDGTSYIVRHWRGKLPLPVSFWINGIATSVALTATLRLLPVDHLASEAPRPFAIALLLLSLLFSVTTLWQIVGILRAARRYLDEGSSRLWGHLARVATLLSLMNMVTHFTVVGASQLSEFGYIAIGRDSLGTYNLQVLRNNTELELSGVITFGLTRDIAHILDKYPTIHIIHLNSNGGRVTEARKLRDLIQDRGLTTYTASACQSACTLAYAAGRERLIRDNARLGFHQYSFPGSRPADFRAEYEIDSRDWLRRGFSEYFVATAFSTPSTEMWTPSLEDLARWGVVTSRSGNNDVAVSGVRRTELGSGIDEVLTSNVMLLALKEYDSAAYSRIASNAREGLKHGRSEKELADEAFGAAYAAVRQKLPFASDSALRRLVGALRDEVYLLTAHPRLCYAYVYLEEPATAFDIHAYLSPQAIRQHFSAMAEVVRSAGEGYKPPDERRIRGARDYVSSELARRHGKQLQDLQSGRSGPIDENTMCLVAYDLYEAILRLPESESGALLRSMYR